MKRTLFTLLAALVATPAFAGNLNSSDWKTLCDDHSHNFTFENGNLVAHGGGFERYKYCELYYTSTAHKMENGSSLAITLQVASIENLYDFTIQPSQPLDAATLYVWADGGYFVLEQLDNANDNWIHHPLSELSDTPASLTLNFIVENNNLCFTYTFNGETSEKITAVEGIDTTSSWQPYFAWDIGNNTTEVTVTDVTFSAPVPEPATATLSLLALAGLATRRRRK